MEGASSYIEVYVYTDNSRNLQSRIVNMKLLTEVFEEMQGKRFDIVLIQSRCIVGNGTYDYTGDSLVTEYENGDCIGFLERTLQSG